MEKLKLFLKQDTHPFNFCGFRTADKGLNVKTIEFVNSDSYNLIQFSDLLMGAIGFQYNNRHTQAGASATKIAFANYISNRLKRDNLNI